MSLTRGSIVLCFSALFLISTIAGCGPKGPVTTSVSGTVTLDGEPVDGASVAFVPDGEGTPAACKTDASGKFTLKVALGAHKVSVSKIKGPSGLQGDTSAAEKMGAPPGTMLSPLPTPGGPGGAAGGPPKVEYLVPQKYGDAQNSGITADVKSGMEPVEISLQSQ